MLPVSETKDDAANTKTIKFAPSPIMSTYLLAFVVGMQLHLIFTDSNDSCFR